MCQLPRSSSGLVCFMVAVICVLHPGGKAAMVSCEVHTNQAVSNDSTNHAATASWLETNNLTTSMATQQQLAKPTLQTNVSDKPIIELETSESINNATQTIRFTSSDAQPAINKNLKRFFRKKVKTIPSEARPKPENVHDPQRPHKTPLRFKPGTLIRSYPDSKQSETAYPMKRRSDGSVVVNDNPLLLEEPVKNAWWTKYLTESPSPSLPYFGADFVHNPSTMLEQQNNLFKSPEAGTMNPYTGFLGFILNRLSTPLSLLSAKQEQQDKMIKEQQQQQQANLASKIRNLYGRNKIPIKQLPARKFLSKLASPYTYYAYQDVQNNYRGLSSQRSRPDLGEIVVEPQSERFNVYNASNEEDNSPAASVQSYPTIAYQRFPSPSGGKRFFARRPEVANFHRFVDQPGRSFASNPWTAESIITPQHQHPFTLHHDASSGFDESRISIIKFSAKDGIDDGRTHLPGLHHRRGETHRMPTNADMFEEDSEQRAIYAQARQPRKIKMGSFVKPRSLQKSDGVFVEKYDLSDIFCKTKFKPIVSSGFAASEARDARFLKRMGEEKPKDASEASPAITFVNSNWTPTKVRSARNGKALVVRSEPMSFESQDNRTQSSPFGAFLAHKRTKRETTVIWPKQSNTELKGPLWESLPEGTLVKKIDPNMTELLLRMLRNSNASKDFTGKRITNVFYVYLPNKDGGETQVHKTPARPWPQHRPNYADVAMIDRSPEVTRPPPPPTRRPIHKQRTTAPRVRATTTTTTTTTTPAPSTEAPSRVTVANPGGFTLNEQDYNFAELLCEGRFSGGIADPRHGCRLYFECNPNTIDTFACPEGYRFDNRQQLCLSDKSVTCPVI